MSARTLTFERSLLSFSSVSFRQTQWKLLTVTRPQLLRTAKEAHSSSTRPRSPGSREGSGQGRLPSKADEACSPPSGGDAARALERQAHVRRAMGRLLAHHRRAPPRAAPSAAQRTPDCLPLYLLPCPEQGTRHGGAVVDRQESESENTSVWHLPGLPRAGLRSLQELQRQAKVQSRSRQSFARGSHRGEGGVPGTVPTFARRRPVACWPPSSPRPHPAPPASPLRDLVPPFPRCARSHMCSRRAPRVEVPCAGASDRWWCWRAQVWRARDQKEGVPCAHLLARGPGARRLRRRRCVATARRAAVCDDSSERPVPLPPASGGGGGACSEASQGGGRGGRRRRHTTPRLLRPFPRERLH